MVSQKTAIIGMGYVGLPLALLAARKNHDVIGIDFDENRIRKLVRKEMPYEDSELEILLKESRNIQFTTDYAPIRDASSVIVCVPTPVHKDTTPDLSPVEGAAHSIAKYLQKSQLIVLESTVNPGITEGIHFGKILESDTGMHPGRDFYLAHCPERINPGDHNWPTEKIARVVGATGTIGLDRAVSLYESLLDIGTHTVGGQTYDVKVTPMRSIESAELVKMLENTIADLAIAGVSQVAPLCKKRNIDLYEVLAAMETKPFGFFRKYPRPRAGVGGHCIPVDPEYLIHQGDEEDCPMPLYRLARQINHGMPIYTAGIISDGLNEIKRSLNGSIVTVLGIAYKPDVGDTRDTPSFPLIDYLRSKGATVRAYDPHVPMNRVPSDYQNYIAPTLNEAVANAHAVVVVTAHKEFKGQLTGNYFRENQVKVVVDGSNCISSRECLTAGIIYKGIGKIPSEPTTAHFTRRFELASQYHGNGHK